MVRLTRDFQTISESTAMKRNNLWNFLVALVFVTVAGVGLSMCRSAPKQNYSGWKKYAPEDYPMTPPPYDSSFILPPFCDKFFHDEDAVHYFPASGGHARMQYNPEIDYLSRGNACVIGAVQRLLYTKSKWGDIELTPNDSVIPGDVYCGPSRDDFQRQWKQAAVDWINGGGRCFTGGNLRGTTCFTAGENDWVECSVNGDEDLVNITVMPNTTGRLRVMTIVFIASYGTFFVSDRFVNNAIYIIQGWD